MGPKNPIPVAGAVLGLGVSLAKGSAAPDGSPPTAHCTAPPAFAKEDWILKDWKSLSGVLGAGAPI